MEGYKKSKRDQEWEKRFHNFIDIKKNYQNQSISYKYFVFSEFSHVYSSNSLNLIEPKIRVLIYVGTLR